MDDRSQELPAHVEETVQTMAKLHAQHYSAATPLQKFLEKLTIQAARPSFTIAITIIVFGWIAANLALRNLGLNTIDAPPFSWLQGAATLTALYMTSLILTTQRREDQLAGHRAQLTLQLCILSERKTAKIIELLEELRRDSPRLANRIDADADALSTSADPKMVLEAIKENVDLAMGSEKSVINDDPGAI